MVGITGSAYYKAAQRQKKNDSRDKLILEEVKRIRKNMPKLGTRKVYYLLKPFLKQNGIKMGRDKLFSLLKANGMLAERRKRMAFTTESRHYLFKYPNLVKEMEPQRPHELWVSDMTYLRTGRGFSYLSLITDAYSRKIVGWSLQPTMHAIGPLEALQMALRQLPSSPLLLTHHSDRGLQYCCHAYTGLLKKNGIAISMTHDTYENCLAERVNGILKDELVQGKYASFTHAFEHVVQVIKIYNQERPHLSLDYLTPAEAHQKSGYLKKHWKKYDRKNKSITQNSYLQNILFKEDLVNYFSFFHSADA